MILEGNELIKIQRGSVVWCFES